MENDLVRVSCIVMSLLKPLQKLGLDGDCWCTSFSRNLAEGVCTWARRTSAFSTAKPTILEDCGTPLATVAILVVPVRLSPNPRPDGSLLQSGVEGRPVKHRLLSCCQLHRKQFFITMQ